MKKALALALAVVLAAAALFFGARYRGIHKDLLAERQAIEAAWNQVEASLRRRAELIPGLTQTVQAEAPDQSGAVGAVDGARRALDAARGRHGKIEANARLDQAVAGLLLGVENHPKLESSRKYGDLLESLKGAEYAIAVARRKYNEAVEHYNARLEMFPDNVVASVAGLRKIDAYFQTPAI